jgi:hypothetical protein
VIGGAIPRTTSQRLLGQVRDAMRIKHSLIHSEEACITWSKRDMYHDVFQKPLDLPLEAIHAKKPKHWPIALTKVEVLKVIEGRQFASVHHMVPLVKVPQCIACAACMGYNRRTAHHKTSSSSRGNVGCRV